MTTMQSLPDIRHLFEPRGVAVIGASTSKGKVGYRVFENIVEGGFTGDAFPINPRGGELLGHRVYTSIDEVEGEVDVALVTVPANHVREAVEGCARKGVGHVVIISSGFSEVGALAEERSLVEYARSHGMRVLGPNVFGIYSSSVSLNATFGPREVLPGNVGIISQSGAIGSAMIGKTAVENLGLRAIISVGNKADIDEADLLEYLSEDAETKVVLLYMEGVRDGVRFIEALGRTTIRKPVVIIKAGRSRRGAMAAASHTGSLAGADEVFDAIVRQAGAIRAEGVQQALDWCKLLSSAPEPGGNNALVITNGGGIGVLAADACERYGVDLVNPTEELRGTFSEVVPEFGSLKNPIDLTGQSTAELYDQCLEKASDLDEVGSVVCLYCETSMFDPAGLREVIRHRFREYQGRKPIVFTLFGGEALEEDIETLRREGVPVFADVYEAVACLGALYGHHRQRRYRLSKGEPTVEVDSYPRVEAIIDEVLSEGRDFLLAPEAHEVMDLVGIPVPRSLVVKGMEEAVAAARDIGFPVVMKVVSRDILHKSDAGGIALDLETAAEVVDAYQAVIRRCRTFAPDAIIEGVEVGQMIPAGLETIIGARRDGTFGPVIMFGLGGIYVEVLKDVSFRALPVDRAELMRMVSEVRSYPLLLGVRGQEKKDIDGIVSMMIKLDALIRGCERITDIEVNPLVVFDEGEGVVALDVRIMISKPQEEC